MKRCIVLFAVIIYGHTVVAQDMVVGKLRSETSRTIKKETDTSTWNWKRGGLMSFNLAQGALSNWAAGGDNFTLSINGYANYFLYFKKRRHYWDNNLDVNLGFVQATSIGSRKNDDRLDYLSKYGYKIDSFGTMYISGLFNFRSQFFDGHSFSHNSSELTSSFLSPAYTTLSAGFDYRPFDKFSVFVSPLTLRATFMAKGSLARKGGYGIPAGKNFVNHIGAFATVNYSEQEIFKNIGYKGRLDIFANYSNNPSNMDIFMTNLFSFKINKFFSATYTLDLIYDDDIRQFGPFKTSPGLQIKSLVGIGFLKPLAVRKVRYLPTI